MRSLRPIATAPAVFELTNQQLTQHICARIYSSRVMLRHNQTTVANKPSACKENFQSEAFDSCVLGRIIWEVTSRTIISCRSLEWRRSLKQGEFVFYSLVRINLWLRYFFLVLLRRLSAALKQVGRLRTEKTDLEEAVGILQKKRLDFGFSIFNFYDILLETLC